MPDRPALTLALDTASNTASVAVLRHDDPVADYAWTMAGTPSEELLAAIDRTLRVAEVARTDLDAVTVVTGPGGYGSLRTGVATAQGLAFGLGLPLAGVGRLDAEAARFLDAANTGATIVAVHDAGRSGVAWAVFVRDGAGGLATTVEARLDEPHEVARAAPEALWCGDLTERVRDALVAAGRDAELASSDTTSAAPSRAVRAARLARQRDAFGDPAGVDVVYLRPPPITRARG